MLAYAVKNLTYTEQHKIDKGHFDQNIQVNLPGGVVQPFPSGMFNTYDDLILAAGNSYQMTMGFTSIVIDTALSDFGLARDLPVGHQHRDLRALVYMIRCAFAHNMMFPKWHISSPAFKRVMTVPIYGGHVVVDTTNIHDKSLHEDDIGGHAGYYGIVDQVRRIVG